MFVTGLKSRPWGTRAPRLGSPEKGMVVTRHPRVETLGYYWSRICAPCGRVFISGLKSAAGTSVPFIDRAPVGGTPLFPNHNPGLQSRVVPALGHPCPKIGVAREGDGCDQTSQG